MEVTDDIIVIDSGRPGPSVALLAGVHGNEKAGVYALQHMLPLCKPTRGIVYAAFANPPAIAANVRMLSKNLNRCFYAGNKETDPEDIRARVLMAMLDRCDALLDLHMFYDDDGVPFVICEPNGIPIARNFAVPIISTNWDKIEPGASDSYMNLAGKIGICVECGPITKSYEMTDFAQNTVLQFLKYFDMIDDDVVYDTAEKTIIETYKTVYKTDQSFVLQPGLKNFQQLTDGQCLARDKRRQYYGAAGDRIIFPHYGARVGEEAYILGKVVE